MELPFTIVFEPPSRAELRALLRMRGHWAAGLIVALTIGTAYLLSNVARADAGAAANAVPLQLTSEPAGASAWVDGRQLGPTPVDVPVQPGVHNVLLKSSGAIDTQYAVDVGSDGRAFGAVLWRRQPAVTHLRSTLPGATLADVRWLASGALGLSVSLPPGPQIEAWSLDARTGAVRRVMDAMPGAQLAFAPDARHLAFLGPDIGPPLLSASSPPYAQSSGQARPAPRLSVVWLVAAEAGPATPVTGWRVPLEQDERLVDVSWSPRADRLLVVAGQPLPGGARRSRAWLVDADGQHAEPVLSLPSDFAPGSEAWSPDGSHVAFVAHAGQVNALCLLGTDGSFRYLADLDPSSNALLAYPPLSWSADGQRMVFVAPHQRAPGAAFDWLAPATQHAVYLSTLDPSAPTLLADTALDEVTWREDDQLLGVWRAGPDAPLGVRVLNAMGTPGQDVVQVPLKPSSTYAALWDLAHAQMLISSRNVAGGNDYWLVRLGVEDQL